MSTKIWQCKNCSRNSFGPNMPKSSYNFECPSPPLISWAGHHDWILVDDGGEAERKAAIERQKKEIFYQQKLLEAESLQKMNKMMEESEKRHQQFISDNLTVISLIAKEGCSNLLKELTKDYNLLLLHALSINALVKRYNKGGSYKSLLLKGEFFSSIRQLIEFIIKYDKDIKNDLQNGNSINLDYKPSDAYKWFLEAQEKLANVAYDIKIIEDYDIFKKLLHEHGHKIEAEELYVLNRDMFFDEDNNYQPMKLTSRRIFDEFIPYFLFVGIELVFFATIGFPGVFGPQHSDVIRWVLTLTSPLIMVFYLFLPLIVTSRLGRKTFWDFFNNLDLDGCTELGGRTIILGFISAILLYAEFLPFGHIVFFLLFIINELWLIHIIKKAKINLIQYAQRWIF